MKALVSLLFMLLFPLTLSAQTVVTSHVVDDKGEALPSVIIKRYATGHRMRGYASSGGDGSFSIRAEAGDSLEFSMLGFETRRIAVTEGMGSLTVRMTDGAIKLREVTVKSDKVHERGDTVTYIVGAYANGNDRTIGDVIAKMPGFDVDKATGKISYEGKAISKFYIEGLDMLGGKYGVATNTLPQGEVGSVQVMRNHQPIRVLQDFTFTDDAAVNIKMKAKAKTHWVTSWKAGGGYGDHHADYDKGLWRFEGFGLRLKSDFQTMLTYKTNNTGEDVGRESTNLFNFDDFDRLQPADFIRLASPSVSGVSDERSLMNRSHALTANVMRRFGEDSQLNLQLVYDNERDKAWGERETEYILSGGNRVISNDKSWRSTDNDLYTLLKYEHNSSKSYLSNSLSGDMRWLSQRLYERERLQHSRLPVFDFRDNLYVIRRFGNTLISFYSNNDIQQRPQHLYVTLYPTAGDSISDAATSLQTGDMQWDRLQNLFQRFYFTDTYASGSWKLWRLSLSMKLGVKGILRYLKADAYGLPDSLNDVFGYRPQGPHHAQSIMNDDSHFGFVQVYASPNIKYATSDVKLSLAVPFANTYYKYSADSGKDRFDVSPTLNIRWDVTSRFSMSLIGSYSVEQPDFNCFYGSLVMQDYLYLNRGYRSYDVSTRKTVSYGIVYRNSLQGTHLSARVSRSFNTTPYTSTREFVGDYIITGTTPIETKDNSWNATLMYQQGLPFLGGKFALRGFYTNTRSKMIQNGELYPSEYNMLNTSASLFITPYTDMSVNYEVRYGYNDMKPDGGSRSSFNNWQHIAKVIVPAGNLRFTLRSEYDHNQLMPKKYKDIFFADAIFGLKTKHIDYELALNNILNKRQYSLSTVSDLMAARSVTAIRGRELLLTLAYKP